MLHVCCVHNRHLESYPVGLGTDIGQPRPQGLLAFQYGGCDCRKEVDPNKGGGVLPGGGTLGLFGWGSAAGTLEPLAYTIASSSEFCYPILD